MRNFADLLDLSVDSPVSVNSETGVSLDRLDTLFHKHGFGHAINAEGSAPLSAVSGVFSGNALVGSPAIRDVGLDYARKPDGQPYSRRRIQQWMKQADFFVWRDRIPATMPSSWHAYLDCCINDANRGRNERTAKVNVITPTPGGGTSAIDVTEIPVR